MRLAWIFLALVAVSTAWDSSSSDATTPASSTMAQTDVETTTSGVEQTADTVTGGTSGPTDEAVTDGSPGPTAEPVTGETEPPVVTDEAVTDDGSTDNTKKPTVAAPTTTKAGPTTSKGSTTTKEPQPDVESFTVHCDKTTEICTYTMQVPGLDIDTFNELMLKTNETETAVEDFEGSDLVELQAGVTKVFDDAEATAEYVASQLLQITQEIKDLEVQSVTLQSDINNLNKAVYDANDNLNKILNKKGSCLYRQCVLKEPTTTRPITTTTVRTTPTPFCDRDDNQGICKNDGHCITRYDSYTCECTGNLDGDDGTDCVTSVCDVFKTSKDPGFIYSPGYNGTDNAADEPCDGASWTVKAVNSTVNVLELAETEAEFKNGCIANLKSPDANLQLTVGKYKLKITTKTKYAQINQILEYGPTAVITYSGSIDDYFHFTLSEKLAPTPTP